MEQIKLLSQREREVVALLMQCKSNKQIALSLGVSERTVEFHLKNIYTKLQVNSRVELILNLGKTTVDISGENNHNGKQPVTQKKESAMKKINNVDVIKFQPTLLWTSMLFLVVGLSIRYLVIDIGLYFWLSYVTLGVVLATGSLYLGFSWRKKPTGNIYFHPFKLAIFAALPVCSALIDIILRYIIARITGQVSFTFIGISNKIMWIVPSSGNPYFHTDRIVQPDNLWFYVPLLCMFFLFFVGILASKRNIQREMSSS
jgi:DNA-binding CsgD family transcriptional regulator